MSNSVNRKLTYHGQRIVILTSLLATFLPGYVAISRAQNIAARGPSDVVREFYKAMREHRFKDAWTLTIYKSAVETLTAEEMEDLRPDFEERAAKIPEQVEITGEQINGNVATVFVKIPNDVDVTQTVSEPVALFSSAGSWIIGTDADQALVKKAGRRYFLDAMIETHESDVEDFLKRLIAIEAAYSQQHDGMFGDLKALIDAGLTSHEVGESADGYHFHITVVKDGKSFIAGAEPIRYGHTGKRSFWMDQAGTLKKTDNGGKPMTGAEQGTKP